VNRNNRGRSETGNSQPTRPYAAGTHDATQLPAPAIRLFAGTLELVR
jgi:hypothetical protein